MNTMLGKAAVVAAALGIAGSAAAQDIRFVVVSHGQASDPFWSVVKNGVDQAAEDMGVTVEYQAPDTFDMVQMAQIIDAAVASQPDGLVVSIPDAEALGDSIRNAVASGIPVISMNSGSDVREELGVADPCRPDRVRGRRGRRQADGGGRRHQGALRQSGGRQRRPRSALRGLHRRPRRRVEVLAVSMDPTEIGNAVRLLSADPDIDGVLTLGPTGAAPPWRRSRRSRCWTR